MNSDAAKMSSERLKHPFGRENEVAVQLLFKSFCNHLHLGQWELAVASVKELFEQKDVLAKDVSQILRQIICTAYRKSLLSEAVPSYQHLAWLAITELNKLDSEKKAADLCLQEEVEFRLLLLDSCKNADEDIIKELYLTFLGQGCAGVEAQSTHLTTATLDYLSSLLLTLPSTGHHIISYLLRDGSQQNAGLETIKLHCLHVLLTTLSKNMDHAQTAHGWQISKLETLRSTFCSLLSLYDPQPESGQPVDRLMEELVVLLCRDHFGYLLSRSEIISCLLGRKTTFLLEKFFGAESRIQELYYIKGEVSTDLLDTDLNCQSLDRTSHRDRLFVGLSLCKNRSDAWRDMFVYCFRHEKHFLELFVDTALHLIQTDDVTGLSDLFKPVEFSPLKPTVLLLGWNLCSDVQTAGQILNILWTPQIDAGFEGIAASCNRLASQVQLTQWCLDKARLLSGFDQHPASSLKSFFRGLELHSALYMLHHSTSLMALIHDEVMNFLRDSAAATEPLNELPKEGRLPLTKQVQFLLEADRTPAVQFQSAFNVEQEKDINTYKAFTILKLFMDIMAFSGEVSTPWDLDVLRYQNRDTPECSPKTAHGQTAHCVDIIEEMLRLSQSSFFDHSWWNMQQFNYSMLYKQNVLNVITVIKKHICELYPLNYRLEVIENVFSLLFSTQEDLFGLNVTEKWDSGEEGAIGDRHEDTEMPFVDDDTEKDKNHNDEPYENKIQSPQGRAPTSIVDAQLLYTRGQHSSTSNHSASSSAVKVGFLANELIIRDILLTVKELLDNFESSIQALENNETESNQCMSSGCMPNKSEHKLLTEAMPCSIQVNEVNQRYCQLMHYVSTALWRFQLVAKDWIPREYGRMPSDNLDQLEQCYLKVVQKGDEHEQSKKNRREQTQPSGIIQRGHRKTSGSQSGTSVSSSSSQKHNYNWKKQRRRHRSWKCQMSEVMDPITQMLSDEMSLLKLCLKQGKFKQAEQVVKMFDMDQTELAKEARFVEHFQEAAMQLRSYDSNPCQHQMKHAEISTRQIPSGQMAGVRTNLTSIATVAAAGLSSMLISNSVDHVLSLSDLPQWQSDPSRPHIQKCPLESLCSVYLDPLCIPAITCLDLACISSHSWKTSFTLIEMATKRLPLFLGANSWPTASFSGSNTSAERHHASLHATGHFGYGNLLHRLSQTINLGHNADDSHLYYYCCSIPVLLTKVTLPFDSGDLQQHADSIITVKNTLRNVTNVIRRYGIWPYRGQDEQSSSVLSAVTSFCTSLQKLIPGSGWLHRILHKSQSSAGKDYLQALVKHVVSLMQTLDKLSSDKNKATHQEPFCVLKFNPIKLLASLIFDDHVHPASLEPACQLLHIDIIQVIMQSTCPAIPLKDKSQLPITDLASFDQTGHIILNQYQYKEGVELGQQAEYLVRILLTQLVQLMKDTAKRTPKNEMFSSKAAQMLVTTTKYRHLVKQTGLLQYTDLSSLDSEEKKKCFYGNLLTLMGIHMWLYTIETEDKVSNSRCQQRAIGGSIMQTMSLILKQNQLAYRVGQLGVVSYFDLRYVITRQGLVPPSCFNDLVQYRISTLEHCDPWVIFGCRGDPAMTFAVADGTPASPVISILSPELVKYQLTNSVRLYMSNCIQIDKNNLLVSMSPLLWWYLEDCKEQCTSLVGDANTIADVFKEILPEDCRDNIMESLFNPGQDHMYKVKTFQYQTDWPVFWFSTEKWQHIQQHITCPGSKRRPSLPQSDNIVSESWPIKDASFGARSTNDDLSVLNADALTFVSDHNDSLAAVISIIGCDSSDTTRDCPVEDYKLSEEGKCLVKHPGLDEYRNEILPCKYPILMRHVGTNSLSWLVELGPDIPTQAHCREALETTANHLSKLDVSVRSCLLHSLYSRHSQEKILKTVYGLLEQKQWHQLSQFISSFSCDQLKHFNPNVQLLCNFSICCALTVIIEEHSSHNPGTTLPPIWPLLLKICDPELKSRMVLGTLHHWNEDICLQLLRGCLHREHRTSKRTILQQLVTKRLEEILVYKEITSCAKDMLSKLGQSESFLLSCDFDQNMSDEPEASNKTPDILRQLCQWQGVVNISNQAPELVLEVLTHTKNFVTAYKWARIYDVFDRFEQVLRQVHITSLLDKSPVDVVSIYQVLSELRQHDSEKCFEVCNNLINKLTDTSHVLCIVQFMINQLRPDLGQRRISELSTMCVGCKAVLCLPVQEQTYYKHLISSPLLILEQLLINNKLEWAKLVLSVYAEALSRSEPAVLMFTTDDCDKLLEKYATKAVEFPILENSETCAPGLSHSGSRMSLTAGVSLDARIHRNPGGMMSSTPRSLHRTASVGVIHTASVGSPPVSISAAASSASFGARCSQNAKNNSSAFVIPPEPPPKEQWLPDSSAAVCMICQVERFSMFNRRHHCRRCGRVVCGACSMRTTIICGRSARTCDQCYQQIFPVKSMVEQSDFQRLRKHLSNISPDGTHVSPSPGNLNVTVGSASASQETDALTEQRGNDLTYSEFFYQLSLDDELNNNIREEFYYDHAPSMSLCLSLLDLHSNSQRCAHVLLSLCEKISQHLKPIAPGVRNPEVDYGLVISMMKRMLMSAKVKYIKAGDSSGVSQCGVYIDRVNLVDQLLSNNCTSIPSICQLTQTDTLRCLRDNLIQEERFNLAMDVSTKCGLDPLGVWLAWGKACIRFGDYKTARDKFAKCLKPPVDMNQTQSQSASNILNDIIECLKTSRSNKLFPNIGSMKLLLTDPAQRPVDDLSPDDPVTQECLFYLHNYGTHMALVTFYRQHRLLSKAAHYILDQKCNSDVFLEGLFLPCLSSGMIGQLLEQLNTVDPSLERWLFHLTATCKYLSRNRQINTLYQLQIYMKDYLRAAMTCIQFYLRGATNYSQLHDRILWLHSAKKHMEMYLGEKLWTYRQPVTESQASETVPRLVLTPVEVNKYIYTIEAQLEVTKFLHQYYDNYEKIMMASASSPSPSSVDATSATTSKELPTLFSNSRTKSYVASLVLLCGNNVHDGYGLAFRIIQHFKLDPSSVYVDVGQHFARLGAYKSIYQLLNCIRESGMCSDVIHDDVIMACVNIAKDKPSEVKQLEDLIKAFKNDSKKIEAFISCSRLKSAYLLAVKHGKLHYIRRIHSVAEELGQPAVSAICQQYLQKHDADM